MCVDSLVEYSPPKLRENQVETKSRRRRLKQLCAKKTANGRTKRFLETEKSLSSRCAKSGVKYCPPELGELQSTTKTRQIQLKKLCEENDKDSALVEVNADRPKKKAVKCLLSTSISNNNLVHQANVCVICDRLIIGTAKVCLLEKKTILAHKHRLSVESYNEYYGGTMHPDLERQYQIDDLNGILLPPRLR